MIVKNGVLIKVTEDDIKNGQFEFPKGVTSIGIGAFRNCISLISITFPEGITSIGAFAFFYCSNLRSVDLPNGVTNIGDNAFGNCSSLISITLPEGVTSIEDYVFLSCSNLTSVDLPNGVTNIGYSAFGNCSSLISIDLPEGVTNIGAHAFSYCSSLTSVSLPNSVEKIGDDAFNDCISLRSIDLPNGITSIGNRAFKDCSNLRSINLPDSVTSIGDDAFNGCSSLRSLNISKRIERIGHDAFRDCSSLISIDLPNGVTNIGDDAFHGCSSLISITLPKGITDISDTAFPSWTKLNFKSLSEEDSKHQEDPEPESEGDPKSKCEETSEYQQEQDEPKEILPKKEELIMEQGKEKKTTKIWDQMYRHSPEENVEIVKKWAVKYKPTLKWGLPVLGIYGAYRILNSKNSGLSVENIGEIYKDKTGINLDCLKDKDSLRTLVSFGGTLAGIFALSKVASKIFGNNDPKEITVEQVEETLDDMEKNRKRFGFIDSKTETLFPIALSVIIVYVMTRKPEQLNTISEKVRLFTGKFGTTVKLYLDLGKAFIADKLHVDLGNEDEMQKAKMITILVAILGVGVFLYGRKILGENAVISEDEKKTHINNNIKVFFEQLLNVLKKLAPATFAGAVAWLVSKNVLKSDETDDEMMDVFFKDDEEEPESEKDSKHQEEPENFKEVDE